MDDNLGVLICGFSVGMFNYSTFGMDPFQVFAHGISYHIPIGFGHFYTLLNLLMLIFIFFIDRSKIGLGTIINIFLLGYIVQFSSWMFITLLPVPTLFNRSLLLILGLVILCFGSALYFTADMGVSTYDAVALIMSEKKNCKVSVLSYINRPFVYINRLYFWRYCRYRNRHYRIFLWDR